jgi:hypothetical protein
VLIGDRWTLLILRSALYGDALHANLGLGRIELAGADPSQAEASFRRLQLQVQQELLPPEAPAIAPELAVLLDHPVTGDHDGDPVPAVGQAYRALGGRLADPGGQLLVGNGLAEGNVDELSPDLLLELGAFEIQRHVELLPFSGKVFVQLPADPVDVLVPARDDGAAVEPGQVGRLLGQLFPVGELQHAEAVLGSGGEQRTLKIAAKFLSASSTTCVAC